MAPGVLCRFVDSHTFQDTERSCGRCRRAGTDSSDFAMVRVCLPASACPGCRSWYHGTLHADSGCGIVQFLRALRTVDRNDQIVFFLCPKRPPPTWPQRAPHSSAARSQAPRPLSLARPFESNPRRQACIPDPTTVSSTVARERCTKFDLTITC